MNELTDLKDLITGNMFEMNTPEMISIKADIIIDRKFDIPGWFYDYINESVVANIISIIQYEIDDENEYEYDVEFNTFIKECIRLNKIKKYKEIVLELIDAPLASDNRYCYIWGFDGKLYQSMKPFKNQLTVDNVLSIMKGYLNHNVQVPMELIRLYLTIDNSFNYIAVKTSRIAKSIDKLRFDIFKDEFGPIYSTIYESDMYNLVSMKSEYARFNMFDWVPRDADINTLKLYLNCYCDRYSKLEYMGSCPIMHPNVEIPLTEYFINNSHDYDINRLLIKIINLNLNNVKYLNTVNNNDLIIQFYNSISNYNNSNLDDLNYIHPDRRYPYQLDRRMIISFLSNPNAIIDNIPNDELSSMIQSLGLHGFMVNIHRNNLIKLFELNPIFTISGLSFNELMDVQCTDIIGDPKIVNKLMDVTGVTSVRIKLSQYKFIKHLMKFKTIDKINVLSKYPHLLMDYNQDISFSDINAVLDINPDAINYVPIYKLRPDKLISYVTANGFIKLKSFDMLNTFNSCMNLYEYITSMIDKGIGIGYILDLADMSYMNVVCNYIINIERE